MSAKTLSATEIAELLGGVTAVTSMISRVSGLENAGPDAVVFAEDVRTLMAAMETSAGLILARHVGAQPDARVLVVKDPRYAFALCAKALTEVRTGNEVHASAVIDASAKLGLRVKIGARAVVEADVVLGDDVEIAAGAVILRGVEIGHRVVVQAGAVLGATGFGYTRNAATGEHLLFPQQGRLVIEDDVEIGANTTIDRGGVGGDAHRARDEDRRPGAHRSQLQDWQERPDGVAGRNLGVVRGRRWRSVGRAGGAGRPCTHWAGRDPRWGCGRVSGQTSGGARADVYGRARRAAKGLSEDDRAGAASQVVSNE